MTDESKNQLKIIKAVKSLKERDEILAFQQKTMEETKKRLKEFDEQHKKPVNATDLKKATSDCMQTESGWDELDDDWNRWFERRMIIDGATQCVRDFCKSKGNSNEHCICALEANPKTGFLCSTCDEI